MDCENRPPAVCRRFRSLQTSPELISLPCSPRIDIEVMSCRRRQGVGYRIIDAEGIKEVAIDLVGGKIAPVRVAGLIISGTGLIVGVVARLGELMRSVVRDLENALEPVAKGVALQPWSLRFCWAGAAST